MKKLFKNTVLSLSILCLPLTACQAEETKKDQKKSVSKKEEVCSNLKIRVELGGHLLEFNREDVQVYIENPDKEDTVYKYLDVSKDCDIQIAKNVVSVSNIDIGIYMAGRLSLGTFRGRDGKFFEYEALGKLEQYANTWKFLGEGVQHLVLDDAKGFYLLTKTEKMEKNNDPILFSCAKYQGCSTWYAHPSGLMVTYSDVGRYDIAEPYMYDKVHKLNEKIESFFVKQNNVEKAE